MSKILCGTGATLTSLLLAGLAACAPGRLPSGSYVQVRRAGVVEFEGKALRLADNLTFVYNSWSDDLSSSRYGVGTYQLTGRHLRLRFAAPLPVAASAQVQALAARPDSLLLVFTVQGHSATGPAAVVPYAVVTAYDKANKLLAAASADGQGRAELRLARQQQPARLRAESLGFISWNQDCAVGSAAYQVALPVNEGTPYAAGTIKEFRVRRVDGRRLLVSQGGTQLAMERQPVGQ